MTRYAPNTWVHIAGHVFPDGQPREGFVTDRQTVPGATLVLVLEDGEAFAKPVPFPARSLRRNWTWDNLKAHYANRRTTSDLDAAIANLEPVGFSA